MILEMKMRVAMYKLLKCFIMIEDWLVKSLEEREFSLINIFLSEVSVYNLLKRVIEFLEGRTSVRIPI